MDFNYFHYLFIFFRKYESDFKIQFSYDGFITSDK